jgi:hypothetical protein
MHGLFGKPCFLKMELAVKRNVITLKKYLWKNINETFFSSNLNYMEYYLE